MTLEAQAKHALEILRIAVAEELDRKARLGQYAVIERDGKVVKIGPEEIRALLDEQKAKRNNSTSPAE